MQINLAAPINGLGYGVAGTNIAMALNRHKDVELALLPIHGQIETTERNSGVFTEMAQKGRFFFHDGHSLRIWHQFALAEHVGRGKKIGFPIFELDQFSAVEQWHLEAQDEIFVCSKWAKDIIIENVKGIPVSVVPLGVDTNIFDRRDQTEHNTTVFLNIGKWEKRKGHDVLAEAFNLAFDPSDNVMLVMATSNPFLSPAESHKWEDLYKKTKMGKKIQLVGRLATQEDVAYLMQRSDCGVFPSRGEGWNLEALECMACGLPVIATNYSAHTEFCNEDNSFLVDINELEEAHDGKWFFGQGNWAHIGDKQIEQFAEIMRHIHKKKQAGEPIINFRGVDTANKFSWENSANKIVEALHV